MIVNQKHSELDRKLRQETATNFLAAAVVAAAETSADPFEFDAAGAGLDVIARSQLASGIPNRARMKIFSPQPGHTLVFFYKKSLVPYSRDRYSYGGVDSRASSVPPQEIAAWLDFLTSGFHPDKRPEKLRRAFPYEIPE